MVLMAYREKGETDELLPESIRSRALALANEAKHKIEKANALRELAKVHAEASLRLFFQEAVTKYVTAEKVSALVFKYAKRGYSAYPMSNWKLVRSFLPFWFRWIYVWHWSSLATMIAEQLKKFHLTPHWMHYHPHGLTGYEISWSEDTRPQLSRSSGSPPEED